MSYIRCLSNPECLYVYHHVYDFIAWHMAQPETGECIYMEIPCPEFYNVCEMWERKYGDGFISSGIFSAKEVRIKEDLEEIDERTLSVKEMFNQPPSNYKIRIRYGDTTCYLWLTTWKYVVNNTERHRKHIRKRKLHNLLNMRND